MESCHHRKKSRIEGSIVCDECGMVLEEDLLVETVLFNEEDRHAILPELVGAKRIRHAPTRTLADRLLLDFIRGLGVSVGLPSHIIDRAVLVVENAVAQGVVNRGQSGRRAGAVTLYLLARGDSLPLTLNELAAFLQESPYHLLSELRTMQLLIMKHLSDNNTSDQKTLNDPSLNNSPLIFLERFISYFNDEKPLLSNVNDRLHQEKSRMLNLAMKLAEFSEETSLTDGRMPATVSLACLIVAAEGCRIPFNSSSVCQRAGLKLDTVNKRIRELKHALVRLGQADSLLASKNIKYSRITLFVEELLLRHQLSKVKEEDKLSSRAAEISTMPPSFLLAQKVSQQRRKQIEAAQERLAYLEREERNSVRDMIEYTNDNHSPFNINTRQTMLSLEDVIVERLLLHGINPEYIESLSSLAQLLACEETLLSFIN